MRKFLIVGLLLVAGAACAQEPSSVPSDKAGNILSGSPELANKLPAPQAAADTVSAMLDAAATALAAGRTGEAQEALEEAETRALDRSVPYHDNNKAIGDPVVTEISQARTALGSNDTAGAQRAIAAARNIAAGS